MLASFFGLGDIFGALLCLLSILGNIILGSVVAFLNLLIISAAGWLALLAALLPSMPDTPEGPTPLVLQWINWLFPLSAYVGLLAIMLALWLAMIGIRAGLSFLRAL